MPAAIRHYVRIIDRMSDYVGYVAMMLIFLMVGVLLLDAVTRNVVHIPLHWCIEFAQFTLAAYYFMGGAMTLKNDSHVRMDLFYERLSERGKAKMDLVTIGCMIFYLAVHADRLDLQPEIRHRDRRTALLDVEPVDDTDQDADGRLYRADAPAGLLPGLQAYRHPARSRHFMSYELIAILMFASMMVLLMTGQRVFAAIGFVAAGAALLLYGQGAVEMPFNATFKLFNWFPMLTLPLFIYMGYILAESGIAEDLYRMLHVWFGRVRGGLAIGTIFLMVIISAMNGLSVAGMAIGATIALPEMLRRGYDKVLISGVVQGGSSLGILVPPSVVMVLYGMIARQPVSQLVAGRRDAGPADGGDVRHLRGDPLPHQSGTRAGGFRRGTGDAARAKSWRCCAPASFRS